MRAKLNSRLDHSIIVMMLSVVPPIKPIVVKDSADWTQSAHSVLYIAVQSDYMIAAHDFTSLVSSVSVCIIETFGVAWGRGYYRVSCR